MEKKYIVYGGLVHSVGGRLCLQPTDVMRAYRLRPDECILVNNEQDHKLRGLDKSKFIALYPRAGGDYLECLAFLKGEPMEGYNGDSISGMEWNAGYDEMFDRESLEASKADEEVSFFTTEQINEPYERKPRGVPPVKVKEAPKVDRIGLEMSVQDILVVMSEGNPGALTCMMEMIQMRGAAEGLISLLILDKKRIYGSEIYVLWNDEHNRDTQAMMEGLRY